MLIKYLLATFGVCASTMDKLRSVFLVLILGYLFFPSNNIILCEGESTKSCIERERLALVKFKEGLKDSHGLLSSWMGTDCCRWRGVDCNNKTGHVVTIDLRYQHLYDGPSNDQHLGGEINPSLLDLKHLSYLDLSSNNFGGIGIPDFIGSLEELSYLNLSSAGFSGKIPHQLGNLSSLRYLDLNSLYSLYNLNVENLQWLSKLSSLQFLDMSRVNLAKASDWFHVINMLPSLSKLCLSYCELPGIPTSLPYINLTSLDTLDLSNNDIKSTLPTWLFNISSIVHLDLRFNHFHGPIPDSFGSMTSLEVLQLGVNSFVGSIPSSIRNLCNLRTLDLSSNKIDGEVATLAGMSLGCIRDSLENLNLRNNKLSGNLSDWTGLYRRLAILDLSHNLLNGPIPASLGKLSSLRNLFLSHNELNGTLPLSLGKLSELSILDVSFNSLQGVISEAHIGNLLMLKELCLTSNSLVLNTSSDWVPSFQLSFIGLRDCKLGPKFPSWLKTQRDFLAMDLSNAGISDVLPDWFWDLSHQIILLDLSHNQITGRVPTSLKFFSISVLDLSFNKFEGHLPPLPSNMEYLDFSNNLFSGAILPMISESLPLLAHLLLSNNLIDGTIPASLCKLQFLASVDLSNNRLSGELPRCWAGFQNLKAIDLSNNNLSGPIPNTMGSLTLLRTLHLGDNGFYGELPESLKNCKNLVTLDLGGNRLWGTVPTWIGKTFQSLRILRLRSNLFFGNIPSQLSHLAALQILDLANNSLSGTMPQSLGNFAAMASTWKASESILDEIGDSVETSLRDYGLTGYTENLLVVKNGRQLEYSKTLQYMVSIDLSHNDLSGDIPEELVKLFGLESLNLSGNHLTGKIPDKIGGLRSLESLDLSRNNLSGAIPQSMSLLTYLGQLNLSYNNFLGRIPTGYQLQTLDDPSIYIGNPDLCGPPLVKSCLRNEISNGVTPACNGSADGCNSSEWLGLYAGILLGFVVGFWAVCGTLLFNITWRSTYFHFIDRLTNRT